MNTFICIIGTLLAALLGAVAASEIHRFKARRRQELALAQLTNKKAAR